MLQFYFHPFSPLARRVWIALLEKKIDFEPIQVNLKDGEQFKPEFLALNPFHHVPVIVDDGLRVIESLAILDYLESKYPQPALLPTDSATLARVRMAQMVTCTELSSQVVPLIMEDKSSPKIAQARRKIQRVLSFFTELLGENSYFGGDRFTLGDLVAGNTVVLINKLGFDLTSEPSINAWCDRLMQREVWQKAQPNDKQLAIFVQTVKTLFN